MKNLHKKIGVVVLSVALFMGVVLSGASISHANSSSAACEYQLSSMREGFGFLEEYESENNRNMLKEKESDKYKVWAEHKGDVNLSPKNSHLKRYYYSRYEFIDCVNNHNHGEGFYSCVVGQNSFIVHFKE